MAENRKSAKVIGGKKPPAVIVPKRNKDAVKQPSPVKQQPSTSTTTTTEQPKVVDINNANSSFKIKPMKRVAREDPVKLGDVSIESQVMIDNPNVVSIKKGSVVINPDDLGVLIDAIVNELTNKFVTKDEVSDIVKKTLQDMVVDGKK